jgi:hypothetical protein
MRRLVLPTMGALLAGYVAAHSPLVRLVGRAVGRDIHRCYFSCLGWPPAGRLLDAVAALLSLMLAGGAARLIAARLPMRGAERLLAFGLLALGFVVVPASLLGFAGWLMDARPLRPPAGPLLAAVPAAITIILALRRGWQYPHSLRDRQRAPAITVLLATAAVALIGTSAIIAVTHPPNSYDAISYHAPLAVYFWRDGNLGTVLEQQLWGWALAHPGAMELWAGLVRLAGGERLTNLAQVPFGLMGAGAAYVFARHTRLRRGAALVGALGFLLAPLVVLQMGVQRNDVMGAAIIMTAAALVTVPSRQLDPSRLTLAGLALGLAAATKVAMLPAVGAVMLYLAGVAARTGRYRGIAAASAAFALAIAPWWGRNLLLFGNPIFPAALPLIGRGYVLSDWPGKDAAFVPVAAAWPLYPLIEPHGDNSGFGALVVVGVLPGILAAALWARRGPAALYGLVTAISVPAWWILTRHEPRMLLPVVGLGFGLVGWTLFAVPRGQRRLATWLIGAAAIFSAAVTADQGLRPLSREPSARSEFYERVWGVDSAVAGLPEDQRLLSHTGFAQLSWAADYALLGPHQGRTLITIDGALPTDSIVGIMRSHRIRLVYVPADPESQAQIAAMYPRDRFELLRASMVTEGDRRGIRRYLLRLREPGKP